MILEMKRIWDNDCHWDMIQQILRFANQNATYMCNLYSIPLFILQ